MVAIVGRGPVARRELGLREVLGESLEGGKQRVGGGVVLDLPLQALGPTGIDRVVGEAEARHVGGDVREEIGRAHV